MSSDYFNKTGAENSIARILLKNSGIFNNEKNRLAFENSNFQNLYSEIIDFLKTSSKSFVDIYCQFASNKSTYGFRRGVFTFILSLIIEQNLNYIYISYKGEEVAITPDLFDSIELNPEKYSLNYINFSDVEQLALKNVKNNTLISPYIDSFLAEENLSLAIFDAFKAYIFSLPKIVLATNKSKTAKKLIEGISLNNSKDFFFKKLPRIYKTKDFSESINCFTSDIENLNRQSIEFDTQIEKIISKKFEISNNDFKRGINDYIIKNSISKLKSLTTDKKTFDYYSDKDLVLELSRLIKGFNYKHWRSLDDLNDFELKLGEILLQNNVNEKVININAELSITGSMLKNKLQVDIRNMGRALPKQELKQLLHQLINEI
ncbi:hypothetical protein AAEX28_07915 [Lentisphaerota bacterium WC36G]|nr:hypothetical protein LJT99_10770 [Lentisphaerae bacterium WC36]